MENRPVFLIAVILLSFLAFADQNVTGCQDANIAGETYYLQNTVYNASPYEDFTTYYGNCVSIIADNITLDCQGYGITGNDSANVFGVYVDSNLLNMTMKNCNVLGWEVGVFFENGNNVGVFNSTISSDILPSYIYSYGVISYFSNISLADVNISSSGSHEVLHIENGGLSADGVRLFSNTAPALKLVDVGYPVSVSNSVVYSNDSSALFVSGGTGDILNFSNDVFSSGASDYLSLFVLSGSNGVVLSNVSCASVTAACVEVIAGTNITVRDNRFVSPVGILIYGANVGNMFYGNNITAAVWVLNLGSDDSYFNNSTVGNAYYRLGGTPSWTLYNITASAGSVWANAGSDLPFNASLSGGEWVGYGQDWHPYTEYSHSFCGSAGLTCCHQGPACNCDAGLIFNSTTGVCEVPTWLVFVQAIYPSDGYVWLDRWEYPVHIYFNPISSSGENLACNLTVNDRVIVSDGASNVVRVWYEYGLPNGVYVWNVTCTSDISGFSNSTASQSFVVPVPEIRFNVFFPPDSSVIVSLPMEIYVDASIIPTEENVTCNLTMNGVVRSTYQGRNAVFATFVALSNGAYVWDMACATDAGGFSNTSALHSFTVAVAPPAPVQRYGAGDLVSVIVDVGVKVLVAVSAFALLAGAWFVWRWLAGKMKI